MSAYIDAITGAESRVLRRPPRAHTATPAGTVFADQITSRAGEARTLRRTSCQCEPLRNRPWSGRPIPGPCGRQWSGSARPHRRPGRATNGSKSPVVTELEYIDPLCTVLESGSTVDFLPHCAARWNSRATHRPPGSAESSQCRSSAAGRPILHGQRCCPRDYLRERCHELECAPQLPIWRRARLEAPRSSTVQVLRSSRRAPGPAPRIV
jgi:hypothetical protein